MQISVIIPTYNGKHKIGNTIKALACQSVSVFEIIIVIDGSKDGTEEYLMANNTDLRLTVHWQENKGRAAVRNAGARLAKGDLLIFYDDDMRPAPDCIEQHIKHHQQNPQTLMSGAQIDDDRLADTPFKTYKCFLSNNWTKHLASNQNKPLDFNDLHLTAANFSVRKDIFEKLGGFDESLKDAEDFDLAVRAFKQGYPVYYNHRAFAWHDDFPSCATFIRRQKEYRQYHTYLLEKKPDIYAEVQKFQKTTRVPFIKRLFYAAWRRDWLVKLVDRSRLGFLPRTIQYKLYDWIVAAHVLLDKK